MKQEKNTLRKIMTYTIKVLSFLPTLFLLFLIFGFSAQDGESSGSLSFQVSLFLVRLFSPLIPTMQSEDILIEYAEEIHLYVRKAAHMTEYFLLALSLQLPLTAWLSKVLNWKKRIVTGAVVTVLLAALDEFHQSFVPGRSGNFIDVCIDSIGILSATILLCVISFSKRKRANQ